MLEKVAQIGRQAAQSAGAVLRRGYLKPHRITLKGAIDPVTESDLESQEIIITLIQQHFPDHGILAEEGRVGEDAGVGAKGRGPFPPPPHPLPQSLKGLGKPEKSEPEGPPSPAPLKGVGRGVWGEGGGPVIPRPSTHASHPYRWIIDPLDGTVNFAHGFPMFCVSIAFEAEGKVEYGVVYDPLRDELFEAQAGKGAWLKGRPLKVSATRRLDRALLATGFPYDIRERLPETLARMGRVLGVAQGVRRAGSAALDLCYVACGRLDGFWEEHLKPWDTAAGVLLVKEAGGKITTFSGGDYDIYSLNIVASNGILHDQLLSCLNEQAYPSGERV